MAMLLAPYNNSMRLGQGFNSYTQQICLDRAVLQETTIDKQRTETITIGRNKNKSGEAYAILANELSEADTTPAADDTANDLTPSESPNKESAGNDAKSSDVPAAKERAVRAVPEHAVADAFSWGEEPEHAAVMGTKSVEEEEIEIPPWVKSQIVTYSSRFVDKLSDVTDSMNISGSLSIKTSMIGGTASGSYIDSDKFKSSDINFHLQVKVTNQLLNEPNYNIFNKLDNVDKASFPEVYGDTFISGWEEGGELNAIISMKVLDKAKIYEIKAKLEGELNTASISGKVSAQYDQTKDNMSKDTETTIAINWAGGGSIKAPREQWDIATIKKVAAAFPDLVAITPQRTYAILTKYTSLESFHKQNEKFSPLDYENAGIYTNALLDHYMDYKSLWKQISLATYELEGNRATIESGEPSDDTYDLAEVKDMPIATSEFKPLLQAKEGETKDGVGRGSDQFKGTVALLTGSSDSTSAITSTSAPNTDSSMKKIKIFSPSFAGLIRARKVCRFEMVKIVNEVDMVAKHPGLALDSSRESYFLNPLVFKQLLPIVRSLSPENAAMGIRDPAAELILGYIQPQQRDSNLPRLFEPLGSLGLYDSKLKASMTKLGYKSYNYRAHGCAGAVKTVPNQATFFNDLEKVNAMYRPTLLSVWTGDKRVLGITMEYANGEKTVYGKCDATPSHSLALAPDGSETIVEVSFRDGLHPSGNWCITAISVATSTCNLIDTGAGQDLGSGTVTSWLKPDDSKWSLRGFFGHLYDGAFSSLGVVWGQDHFVPVPPAVAKIPLCKGYLGLSSQLQKSIRDQQALAGKFVLGGTVVTGFVGTPKVFNALDETGFDNSYRITKIAFAAKKSKLSGLKVFYSNQKELIHGAFDDATEIWRCDVESHLLMVKMLAGQVKGDALGYIEAVEFIRADPDGKLPAWPLAVSTLRYLAEGDSHVSESTSQVVEGAPKIGDNIKWSVRGFYGEHSDGIITRLGAIWGRE